MALRAAVSPALRVAESALLADAAAPVDDGDVKRTLPPLPAEDHTCTACAYTYESTSIDAALEVIRAAPDNVRRLILGRRDDQLRARPDAVTWSALEYVCHLRDVLAIYTVRLYRTRTEQMPTLEPMLNDLRVIRFRYNQRDVRPVLDEIRDNAAGLLDEAGRNTTDTWERTANRLPGEDRTARWLIRQAAHELLHHERDIRSVLGRTLA